MGTTYKQPGEVIDYHNDTGSTITVNSVIDTGDRIAVALVDIPDGETGSASVEGVHDLPKATPLEIGQFAELYWNGTAFTTDDNAGANTHGGYAFQAGAEADEAILIKLRG